MDRLQLVPQRAFSCNSSRDLVYGCWRKGARIGGIRFSSLHLKTLFEKSEYSMIVCVSKALGQKYFSSSSIEDREEGGTI